jgi:outer membrane protein TolC
MTTARGAITALAAATSLLLCLSKAPASEVATPLEADEVLASSQQHFPLILQSLAAQRVAEAKTLEAQGAFDLVFSADGFSRVGGFYDGTAINGIAKQNLRPLGASIYAGYKLSEGTFPIYEDINFTNNGGAVKVGMLFSLLRDRTIDDRRFSETDARLGLQQAELEVLLTKIGVQQRALIAYWQWVLAGRKLSVYENLLRLAVTRQTGLEQQVRRGARAQIFLTENLQNILRRQTLVTAAARDFEVAANELSYYYRNDDGAPVVPQPQRLPPQAPVDRIASLAIPAATAASDAITRRPELALLRTAIERERNRIALNENQIKPRLDLNMEVQDALGSIAEGGPSRDSTDTIIGFTFSVPLQRRRQLGRLDQSRAQLEAKQQEQRLISDQIEIQLRNLLLELTASSELLKLAEQEVAQSEIMRESEVRRFESGASDFFLVNIREETAANARIKLYQAELATRVARGNYDAATVDLNRLGIQDESLLP